MGFPGFCLKRKWGPSLLVKPAKNRFKNVVQIRINVTTAAQKANTIESMVIVIIFIWLVEVRVVIEMQT